MIIDGRSRCWLILNPSHLKIPSDHRGEHWQSTCRDKRSSLVARYGRAAKEAADTSLRVRSLRSKEIFRGISCLSNAIAPRRSILEELSGVPVARWLGFGA